MENKARVWVPNDKLEEMANELAQKIYVETPKIDGHWRDATEAEKRILYDIFYTALETLNFYHSAIGDHQTGMDDGVVNMAEFLTLAKLPYANSYLSVYCPLRKVLRNWKCE